MIEKVSDFFKEYFLSINKAQKISLLVIIGICLLLIGLHNPFGGYITKNYISTGTFLTFSDLTLWYYKSRFAIFTWIQELGKLIGLLTLPVIFGIISHVLLNDKSKK